MKTVLAAAVAATAMLAAAPFAGAADQVYVDVDPVPVAPAGPAGGVRIGYLDCDIGGGFGYVLGSAKSVDCIFQSTRGGDAVDRYAGTIRKLGIDVGFTTRQRLVWAVFAPTAGYHAGSLGGLYEGVTAEATAGLGLGANVLVGGTRGSVHLQTVSLTGQVGLNAAATGTSMTLNAVN